jgi:hypothetical protein
VWNQTVRSRSARRGGRSPTSIAQIRPSDASFAQVRGYIRAATAELSPGRFAGRGWCYGGRRGRKGWGWVEGQGSEGGVSPSVGMGPGGLARAGLGSCCGSTGAVGSWVAEGPSVAWGHRWRGVIGGEGARGHGAAEGHRWRGPWGCGGAGLGGAQGAVGVEAVRVRGGWGLGPSPPEPSRGCGNPPLPSDPLRAEESRRRLRSVGLWKPASTFPAPRLPSQPGLLNRPGFLEALTRERLEP